MNKFLRWFNKICEKFEDSKIPFQYFILTFFLILFIRNFLEYFSTGTDVDFLGYFSFFLWYLNVLFSFVIVGVIITKKDVMKLLRLLMSFFIIILFAPIFDLLFKVKLEMSYILPEMSGTLIQRYLTFFGSFPGGMGVTLGLKIEIFILLIGFFLYIFSNTKNYCKSFIGLISAYTFLFIFGALPTILFNISQIINLNYLISVPNLVKSFSILLSILFIILIYLYNKKYFKIILKDLRLTRILFYLLIFFFGLSISVNSLQYSILFSNFAFFSNFILFIFSIFFAIMFSLFTNNLADIKIDSVTNKERPLIKNEICLEHYKNLSWLFLFFSIINAYSISLMALVLVLVFIGIYYLYSMPPWRLKRVPLFSKFMIAVNILVVFSMGIYYATLNLIIPLNYVILILIFFPLMINFIDIKDYEGDKKVGIKTIPTLLGLKLSKILIGISFMISYIFSYFLFDFYNGIFAFLGLILVSLINFWVINKKNYSDNHVLIVVLVSLLFILFNLIF